MPVEEKNKFLSLYKRKKETGYIFFTEKKEKIEGDDFTYLVCNIDLDILKCAIEIGKKKSEFTMNQNQASIPRDAVTKLKKCSQGVLAEMFVHFLLMERYGFDVRRYDLERKTFEYSPEEYDLKIISGNNQYEIESRSSNIHHTSIVKFINNDVIIGPYGNALKVTDELAEFHFRPIYMPDFIPFVEEHGKWFFNKHLIDGTINLVITGVATKEDMQKYGYHTSLGQRGTKYLVVDAKRIGDINTMDLKFKKFKKEI